MAAPKYHPNLVTLDQDEEVGKDRALIACIVIFIVAALYGCYLYFDTVVAAIKWRSFYLDASLVVLTGMTILYFLAASFYKKGHYRFLALGWLTNLLYLFLGSGPAGQGMSSKYATFLSSQMLIALVTDVPFYLAGSVAHGKKKIQYKQFLVPVFAILAWFVVRFTMVDPGIQSSAHVILATLFGACVLFRVYKTIDIQNESGLRHRAARLFRLTFLAFAMLQLDLLLELIERTRPLLQVLMALELALKATNAVALVLMLREDYADVRAKREKERADSERLDEVLRKRTEFEEIGVLAAGIEHELRTPLGVIGARIQDLRSRYQANEDLVTELEILDQQRVRLLAAVRIIKVLRSSQEHLEEKMELIHVADLVRRSIKEIKNSINTEDIFFKVEESKHNLFVRAYKPLLQQAFVNILKNAIESIYVLERGGKVDIEIGLNSQSSELIEVKFLDDGDGFPEDAIGSLTQPGFSIHNKDKENSGLGLFVTERIIKIHRGKMWFKKLEQGVAVHVTLPKFITKKYRESYPVEPISGDDVS